MLNLLTLAVDGYVHQAASPESTLAAIRRAGADRQQLSQVAARWVAQPDVVDLLVRAGADQELVDELVAKQQRPPGRDPLSALAEQGNRR